MEERIAAIDFDGTIVTHEFPEIGDNVPFSFSVLKRMQDAGIKLILYTMRSDKIADAKSDEGHAANRPYLTEAVEHCRNAGIEFWGVNVNPDQHRWSSSPKVYAHIYIDDMALGCPLRGCLDGKRSMVDWKLVEQRLEQMGWLEAGRSGVSSHVSEDTARIYVPQS